jgi:branched-chain amino acid transport system ATP-binding protein
VAAAGMNLAVRGLTKRFGGLAAIQDVTLEFPDGSLTAVIGPNGAGKSTFFNLITGGIVPDAGEVLLDGADIAGLDRAAIVRRGIGRAFQVASIFPSLTVAENLMAAIAAHRRQWAGLGRRFPPPGARARALEVASLLGLEDQADVLSANLSHGDQKLLDIALALALEPRVLLLDEPTAGMGPEERWRMIEKVRKLWQVQKLTLVFIEHDMDIVFAIASSIRVLCYGRVLAQGTPDEIRANPAVIEAYLGTPEVEEGLV